jgi:hypothetical protein
MTPNAILALQNAWAGAIAASDPVRALEADVRALSPEAGAIDPAELERFHNAVFAQANAVLALRGLIEQLRTLAAKDA